MNLIVLCGNLTKDGDLRATHDGNSIFNFTIAVRRSVTKGEQEETDFINCSSFGKLADNMAKYTKKGSKVLVQGKLRIESYNDKDGNKKYSTKVVVDTCTFLNKKEEANDYVGETIVAKTATLEDEVRNLLEDDDDLPFWE